MGPRVAQATEQSQTTATRGTELSGNSSSSQNPLPAGGRASERAHERANPNAGKKTGWGEATQSLPSPVAVGGGVAGPAVVAAHAGVAIGGGGVVRRTEGGGIRVSAKWVFPQREGSEMEEIRADCAEEEAEEDEEVPPHLQSPIVGARRSRMSRNLSLQPKNIK